MLVYSTDTLRGADALSSVFKSSQLKWLTVEKEAYAIVEGIIVWITCSFVNPGSSSTRIIIIYHTSFTRKGMVLRNVVLLTVFLGGPYVSAHPELRPAFHPWSIQRLG